MCHHPPVYCPHVYNAAEVLTIQHQQKQCFMPITFYLYMLFSEKYVEVRLFYYFFNIQFVWLYQNQSIPRINDCLDLVDVS